MNEAKRIALRLATRIVLELANVFLNDGDPEKTVADAVEVQQRKQKHDPDRRAYGSTESLALRTLIRLIDASIHPFRLLAFGLIGLQISMYAGLYTVFRLSAEQKAWCNLHSTLTVLIFAAIIGAGGGFTSAATARLQTRNAAKHISLVMLAAGIENLVTHGVTELIVSAAFVVASVLATMVGSTTSRSRRVMVMASTNLRNRHGK